VAFTFFYVYIAFEPHQQAEMLRQQGGFVPGIRPGMPTEKYFAKMLSRITVVEPSSWLRSPWCRASSWPCGTSTASRTTARRC